jgi:predicted nucleic acid-binding protein
LVILDS